MIFYPLFVRNSTISRATKGKEGKYMALYTMAFSLAHIFSAKLGMFIIDVAGYQTNWLVMGFLGIVAVALALVLQQIIKKERSN